MKTLKNRLILSHVLPLLLIVPLMGITLVYILEKGLLLPNLQKQLTGDAVLLAGLAVNPAGELYPPAQFHQVLAQAAPQMTKRVMLLSTGGKLLASSDPADAARLNQILELDGVSEAGQGRMLTRINYSQRLQGDVVDVFVPVNSASGERLGVMRVTSRYTTLLEEFVHLRYWIAGILLIGLLVGSALGPFLAWSISLPVLQVTQAIRALTQGTQEDPLPVAGPAEIQSLIGSVNSLVERLHRLEQARSQLIANLVHELGRPLGALRMAVQVLLKGGKDEPAKVEELLQGMDQEMAGLQHLLDDLAHLYGQALGPLELNRVEVRLGDWLALLLKPWQEASRAKGIQWKTDLPAAPIQVLIDPLHFEQVVGNLVSNALKFTPPNGRISVSAGENGREAWISIRDTGRGIAPGEMERIFQPFYQSEPLKRGQKGMGLGLAIAQDVVQAHGGRIEVDSRPGKGSEFVVWIPKVFGTES